MVDADLRISVYHFYFATFAIDKFSRRSQGTSLGFGDQNVQVIDCVNASLHSGKYYAGLLFTSERNFCSGTFSHLDQAWGSDYSLSYYFGRISP